MRASESSVQTVKITDVKKQLAVLVGTVSRNKTRVLIEKRGIPVAALVSTEDLARLERLDAEWEATTRALERMSDAFADVPVEELEAKIDAIIAEGRAHNVIARRSA